jgi:hypothetical protein
MRSVESRDGESSRHGGHRSSTRRALALLTSIGLAWTLALGAAGPLEAAPGNHVNVDPESADIQLGAPVVLTATVRDDSEALLSNAYVRWYFAAGSPNDPNPGNSAHDFSCHTDASGSCSISYTPMILATDTICAMAGGSPSACDEAWTATEWDDTADVVLRTVVESSEVPGDDPGGVPGNDPGEVPGDGPGEAPGGPPGDTPAGTPGHVPGDGPSDVPDSEQTPVDTPNETPPSDEIGEATPGETPPSEEIGEATPGETPPSDETPAEGPSDSTATTPSEPPAAGTGQEPVVTPPSQGTVVPPAPPADEQTPPATMPIVNAPPTTTPAMPDPSQPESTIVEPDGTEPSTTTEPPSAPGGQARIDQDLEPRTEPRAIAGEAVVGAIVPAAPPAPVPPAAPAAVEASDLPGNPGAVLGMIVGQVVTAAVEQVARYVHPDAAAAIATQFGFPLALALAVLAFLIVQGHVDRRDPKLRIAPQNVVETLVKFEGEDTL